MDEEAKATTIPGSSIRQSHQVDGQGGPGGGTIVRGRCPHDVGADHVTIHRGTTGKDDGRPKHHIDHNGSDDAVRETLTGALVDGGTALLLLHGWMLFVCFWAVLELGFLFE